MNLSKEAESPGYKRSAMPSGISIKGTYETTSISLTVRRINITFVLKALPCRLSDISLESILSHFSKSSSKPFSITE